VLQSAADLVINMIAGGNHTIISVARRGAPRSESKISMLAGGKHTLIHAVTDVVNGKQLQIRNIFPHISQLR